MIGSLIAGVAFLGLLGHFDNGSTATVPFTFESSVSPDSPLLGTKKTLFVAEFPHVVAIDAGSGKRLWETSLTSHAALLWGFNRDHCAMLGAFPVEVGGSVAFCFTYAKTDGTIETEIESRRRKDGALNFIVHVETSPVSTGRPSYGMTWPNVFGLGSLLLVVPDPDDNPQLFVLSAATGVVQAQIRPGAGIPSSLAGLLGKANTISFGACVYAGGELISLADSPFGPPSRLVYLGDRILAQYLGESFVGAPSLSERQGVALFPWGPTQHGRVEDIWHGAFVRPPKEKQSYFGSCLGQREGNPVILCTDWRGVSSLVEINENGNVVRTASLDTPSFWKVAVGVSDVFLLYGRISNDLYDLQGNKLLSLSNRTHFHATLLPCGVAWTNYSRVGSSDKFKFVGAVVSVRNKRLGS